jgi:hypothetical protein
MLRIAVRSVAGADSKNRVFNFAAAREAYLRAQHEGLSESA